MKMKTRIQESISPFRKGGEWDLKNRPWSKRICFFNFNHHGLFFPCQFKYDFQLTP